MSILPAAIRKPAAVLRITGEDQADFLQSQGTADLRGPAGLCRYSLWLDHKGLIHGDGFVLRTSDGESLLVSYECPVGQLKEMFERHIIADDVELTDETDRWTLVSIPPGAARERGLVVEGFRSEAGGYHFCGRLFGTGTADLLIADPETCGHDLDPMPGDAVEGLRIAAGIPSIPRDIPPGRLNPVEANLISALSFDKGCYLGQEVVARVHRLQRVSKRLVRLRLEAMPDGMPLVLADGERPVGSLTTVVKFHDSVSGIGLLKARYADGPHSFDGLKLEVETLPPS